MRRNFRPILCFVVIVLVASGFAPSVRADYSVTNLVSNIQGLAANYDPNLQNPWGVSSSPTGPFWVSDQNNNKSTLYNGAGSPISLVVSIPTTGTGPQGPTGQVWNGNKADFLLANNNSASFLFANLNGQISAWNGGTSAQVVASGSNAVYTGLAIGAVSGDNVLFAADNAGNKIDVYNRSFQNLNSTTYANTFVDPFLPSGYHVNNIQNIGGVLYVVYNDDAGGNAAHNGGFVAEFGLNGTFIKQLIAGGPGGPLEDPWGIVVAPQGFGKYSGSLLVGNTESGQINAFDATTGAFLGLVATVTNDPTSTDNGLWALTFGNGGSGGSPTTLYAFAGINGEVDGLVVGINAVVPEPGSAVLLGIGGSIVMVLARRNRRRAATPASLPV